MKNVAVLASGRGTNLGALLRAQASFSSYRVTLVVSNIENSGALGLARASSLEGITIPSRGTSREAHERELVHALSGRSVEIICLAGYMRLLSPGLIETLAIPIMNVHPSLLPAFPGLHAPRQAIEAGVRWSGATVHFVDSGLDTGPIILQEPVRVEQDDTVDSLSDRILQVEHRLYPSALDIVAREAYRILGPKTVLDPR